MNRIFRIGHAFLIALLVLLPFSSVADAITDWSGSGTRIASSAAASVHFGLSLFQISEPASLALTGSA